MQFLPYSSHFLFILETQCQEKGASEQDYNTGAFRWRAAAVGEEEEAERRLFLYRSEDASIPVR